MKATDIMIGDWVVYATRPMVIDGIAVGGASVHSSSENWVPVSSVEGVPLTVEILERKGYEDVVALWKQCEFFVNI